MYQRNWSQTHNTQTHHQEDLICPMIAITQNPKERKCDTKKKRQKNKKQDLSDSLLSDYDSSVGSDHRHKRRKKKSHKKKIISNMCNVNGTVADGSI